MFQDDVPLLPHMGGRMVSGDPHRHFSCQPGRLIYSAKFDHNALAQFYKCNNCYCSTDVVNRTYADVYSNGVLVNAPRACCCCWKDHARLMHFDDVLFMDTPVVGGCCTPYPHCCPHFCDLFGETLVFRSGPAQYPSQFAHCAGQGCCPIEVLLGLPLGEGLILSSHLQNALFAFRTGKREIVAPVIMH